VEAILSEHPALTPFSIRVNLSSKNKALQPNTSAKGCGSFAVLSFHSLPRHKRDVRGGGTISVAERSPQPLHSICLNCGVEVGLRKTYCTKCAASVSRDKMVDVARVGRESTHTPQAQSRRADTQRRIIVRKRNWTPSSQPDWLTKETFVHRIVPLLAGITNSAIASALGVSHYHAADIRRGRSRPHPRHWEALAQLVGVVS
jgi:hypothetical protein